MENTRSNDIYWEDSKLVFKTRSGKVYKFEEQTGQIIKDARTSSTMIRVERGQRVEELNEDLFYNKMIVKSCVEPQLKESEFDINKLPGSEGLGLRKVINELYDIQAFLE